MNSSYLKIGFLFVFALVFLSCQNNKKANKMEEKYSWGASVTSAQYYSIEVHEGYLATKKEFITGLSNAGIQDNSWLSDGSDCNSGGNKIPTLVSITWLSYAEKTFWKLDEGALNPDLILSYFKKGYENYAQPYTGKLVHETYNHITVAVAPGGEVGIFLTGKWHRVQVGRFKAHKIDIPVNQFSDNPHEYTQQEYYDVCYNLLSEETQADIKKNGIPFGLWTQYDERYNYRIVPQFYKDDFLDDLQPSYFNGEEDYFHREELKQQIYLKKALPFRMNIGFSKYNFSAVFKWDEIHEAFKTLTKNDKQAKIDIIAKVGFEYNSMTFSAKCGDVSIELPSTTGEMHSSE